MKITEVHLRDPYILLDNNKYYMYGTRGTSNGRTSNGFDVFISDDLIDWDGPFSLF